MPIDSLTVTFIVYLPGYAGNFILRLFGLSLETIPYVPKEQLINNVINGNIPDIGDRSEWYSFSQVPAKFNTWQEFHRHWPDYHEHNWFVWMNDLYNHHYTNLMYAMHPHEFVKFEPDINTLNNKKFYYVNCDGVSEQWIRHAQKKLGFEYRKNETTQYRSIIEQYDMTPISLGNMMRSDSSFSDEYSKICTHMGLTADLPQAMKLFQDWRSIRVDCGS